MKCRAPLLVVSLFLLVVSAEAAEDLLHARRAQGLLGAGVWSRVIQIEKSGSGGPYPSHLHALVFELAGILWFYTDVDGTQSLSTQRGRLTEDKADFGGLLREIDPGFTAWSVVPDDATASGLALGERGPLLNGCLIESVAALRARVESGQAAERAQLLSFYVERGGRAQGHTVLTFETLEGIAVIDPLEPDRIQKFSRRLGRDARSLASALLGGKVARARWLAVGALATRAVDSLGARA